MQSGTEDDDDGDDSGHHRNRDTCRASENIKVKSILQNALGKHMDVKEEMLRVEESVQQGGDSW